MKTSYSQKNFSLAHIEKNDSLPSNKPIFKDVLEFKRQFQTFHGGKKIIF